MPTCQVGDFPDRASRICACVLVLLFTPSVARGQFLDDFTALRTDPDGLRGWSWFSGDGQAQVSFERSAAGEASIRVDATRDRRNVWWALIKRKVSDELDLRLLQRPGYALRIGARLRVSHAPRRVNLHVNTQRTTDFHSHLMEFDIPDADRWHTISFTTRDFDARPGDIVYAQLALMDWGFETYRVELDWFRVDIVDRAAAGPDEGYAVPYHPPVPDRETFREQAVVSHDSTIDAAHPETNLEQWSVREGGARLPLLAVGGTLETVLRFDLSRLAGRIVDGHGLLELTTRSVQRSAEGLKDFGLVRVVEILSGDPDWDQRSVTADSLRQGRPLSTVLNPQPIIDWPVTEGDGGRTYLTISRPVLQRLVDGRTLGIAIRPLGAIMASFYSRESRGGRVAPRLLFNLRPIQNPHD